MVVGLDKYKLLIILDSIQPPGTDHMVFTAEPTVMSGGHIYTYDTMHLTEFVLMFDLGRDRGGSPRIAATNAAHAGAFRKVYRMAIALPKYAASRSRFP